MNISLKHFPVVVALGHLSLVLGAPGADSSTTSLREPVQMRANQEYPRLFELYKHLHTHPELSLHEEKTGQRVADELKEAGFEVTTRVGGHGVVGVLRNGRG